MICWTLPRISHRLRRESRGKSHYDALFQQPIMHCFTRWPLYAPINSLAQNLGTSIRQFIGPWIMAEPKTWFRRIASVRSRQIALIGETFILLQENRHWADYDPSPFRIGRGETLGRAETLDLIEQARLAVAQIKNLTPEDRLFVASHLIARPRS
jgi:hypothetical protein